MSVPFSRLCNNWVSPVAPIGIDWDSDYGVVTRQNKVMRTSARRTGIKLSYQYLWLNWNASIVNSILHTHFLLLSTYPNPLES